MVALLQPPEQHRPSRPLSQVERRPSGALASRAQAVATAARMLPGGLRFGVGSGEALNEHVVGERWATADVRLEMLEEAIGVIRHLLTGERVDHHGTHLVVEDARLYTLPARPVPILVSGLGAKAIACGPDPERYLEVIQ